MIMKQFCHAILACGVFAAIVAAASCTKDATGGGGGGYDLSLIHISEPTRPY